MSQPYSQSNASYKLILCGAEFSFDVNIIHSQLGCGFTFAGDSYHGKTFGLTGACLVFRTYGLSRTSMFSGGIDVRVTHPR